MRMIVLFLAAFAVSCATADQALPCDSPDNEHCLSVFVFGEVKSSTYNAAEASRIASKTMSKLVAHQSTRTSQEAAQAAASRGFDHTVIIVTDKQDVLEAACGYEPDEVNLLGCTKTDSGVILLWENGPMCVSALPHEFNHKMLYHLYEDWDYDHVDASWAVVDEVRKDLCDVQIQ